MRTKRLTELLAFLFYIWTMNLYAIRSHVKLVAEMLRLSKDSRIRDKWIDFIVAYHRARGIREEFARSGGDVDPTWLQDFGKITVTKINSGDDPDISYTSKNLGKVSLPVVVSLPEDKGVYRIANSSKLKRYNYSTEDEFFSKVPGSISTDFFEYYFRKGTAYYLSDAPKEITATLILENPMEGVVLLTEKVAQSELIVGTSYTVYGFQITHNSVAYNPGASFTAATTTYTGAGYVKFTTQKRDMLDTDPYPMGMTLLEYVMIKIFTIEFAIEKQQVSDVLNDAAVQEQLNQNANAISQAKQ